MICKLSSPALRASMKGGRLFFSSIKNKRVFVLIGFELFVLLINKIALRRIIALQATFQNHFIFFRDGARPA